MFVPVDTLANGDGLGMSEAPLLAVGEGTSKGTGVPGNKTTGVIVGVGKLAGDATVGELCAVAAG